MQVKVYSCGQEVGCCLVKDEGLYWYLECDCIQKSDELMGLFGAGHYLGLPEKIRERLRLRRRIAKSSIPSLTEEADTFLLLPRTQKTVTTQGKSLTGYLERIDGRLMLRIPCTQTQPHPCMALFCFFQYDSGFWRLHIDDMPMDSKIFASCSD